jgi:glycosyltransferase involved in cell wall biosynthesis
MKQNGRYCVVIPAFDAEKTIGELIEQIKRHELDVIVVNDGSRDQTASIAAQRKALVISHLHNQGKGEALRTGFEHALRSQYDGVVTIDSDGQHDPAEIPQLIRAGEVQHAGIVLGNRMHNGQPMPPMRRWANTFMSDIVSAVACQRIPDSQCGFRFIRKEVLQDIALQGKRFEIETELLLRAAGRRWKIISVPVRSIYQEHPSHIRPLRDAVRFLGLVLRHLCWQR